MPLERVTKLPVVVFIVKSPWKVIAEKSIELASTGSLKRSVNSPELRSN